MFVKIRLNVIRKLYYMIIMENKINNGRLFEKIIYTLFFCAFNDTLLCLPN